MPPTKAWAALLARAKLVALHAIAGLAVHAGTIYVAECRSCLVPVRATLLPNATLRTLTGIPFGSMGTQASGELEFAVTAHAAGLARTRPSFPRNKVLRLSQRSS